MDIDQIRNNVTVALLEDCPVHIGDWDTFYLYAQQLVDYVASGIVPEGEFILEGSN